jgi:hypothetical protein
MLRDLIDPSKFFPLSEITLPFGWDPKTLDTPRIHQANDRALPWPYIKDFDKHIVYNPAQVLTTAWIDDDGLGNTILRLMGDGFELRCLHFARSELDEETRALIIQRLPIQQGARIGPAGNVGISLGRHVHYMLIVDPGRYDGELEQKWGEGWNRDRCKEYVARYGQPFTDQIKSRKISWMNEYIIAKTDPYRRQTVYVVDAMKLLGL